MFKNIGFYNFAILFLFSISFLACGKRDREKLQMKSLQEWNGIVEKGVLNEKMIPFLSNISEMSLYDGSLLLQQEKMDTSFIVWDIKNSSEKYFKFGQIGGGPLDVLRTSLLLHDPDADNVRILDGLSIKTFELRNDSVIFGGREKCDASYNFYSQISVVEDSLCCVKISSPHDTGLYLMNIYSREVFDSINVNRGYFDDKICPWDFNFCLYNNKIVIGRSKYDQIEVYKLNLLEKRFEVDYILNYNGASPENVNRNSACYMRDIVADDSSFYLLNQKTSHFGKETYVDVYKWDGTPVKRVVLDDLYLQMVLLDGKLYLKKYSDDDHIYIMDV